METSSTDPAAIDPERRAIPLTGRHLEKFLEYGLEFGEQVDPHERRNLWLGALRHSLKIRRNSVITESVDQALSNLPATLAAEDLESAQQVAEILILSDDFAEIQLGVKLATDCLRLHGTPAAGNLQLARARGVLD